MKTVKFKISQDILFDLLGLNCLDGIIDVVESSFRDRSLTITIYGDDDRLPNSSNYPEKTLVCTKIQAHFE
jgi:hypothetical protein